MNSTMLSLWIPCLATQRPSAIRVPFWMQRASATPTRSQKSLRSVVSAPLLPKPGTSTMTPSGGSSRPPGHSPGGELIAHPVDAELPLLLGQVGVALRHLVVRVVRLPKKGEKQVSGNVLKG